MFKYILGYVIILLGIYYCNDNIIHLLSGNLALVRFIELTLPLSVPSLMYFLQVSKDRYERIEKEKQKESKRKMEEEDKFERSLPFFYVRNGTIFAKSPQKSPILNVKIKIDIIKNDFGILDELSARGEVDSENIIPVGGLIDGDEINLDYLLESNSISKCIRWFVLSAVTITNDIVYFIYLPYLKTGWHFYRRKDGKKPKIVQYIGEERYYELAKFLVAYVSEQQDEFYYKESILNDAVTYLNNNDLQESFAQLINLVRRVKELPKSEILYVLHKAYLMLNYLKISHKIEPNYFNGNLFEKCNFTDKYTKALENQNHEIMIREYLQDIIKLVNNDSWVSLDFWLRNVEVYVRDQSCVLDINALERELRETIPSLVGGLID
ncbi:hypothetical protein [Faecalicatena orotica]|uniref:hypothetical protein n=1 Tax=Faecalicatena orotica TaxID=1544 RepID=UPI00321657C3